MRSPRTANDWDETATEEIEEWFVKVRDLGLDGVTVSLPANGTIPERIEQLGEVAVKVFGSAQ